METPTRILPVDLTIEPALVRALPKILTGGTVAGGIALRWAGLGRKVLWMDEGYTAWVVSNPCRQIVRIIGVDTAPPLYYLLLRGWTQLFGFSESALRSMSALMSTVALLVFVAIARRMLKSTWAVMLAVSLFSFSFMQVGYAHEARFYAMMTMMGAIDLYLVLLVCDRATGGRLAATCIAWAISLWTNNMMAVYLACLGAAWLVLPGERKLADRLKDALIVSAVAGLSFLPWLPTMLAQAKRLRGGFWALPPDAWGLSQTVGVLEGVHESALPRGDQHLFFIISLILVGLMLLACASRPARRSAIAMFSFGILPILLIFVYSHACQSIFMDRAFLASSVAIPILMVLPIESKGIARKFAIFCVSIMLLLNLRSIPGHWMGEHFEDWRHACEYATHSSAKHRLVICASSDGETLFRYYACHRDYGPRTDVTGSPASFFAMNPPMTMQRLKTDHDVDRLRARLAQKDFDEVVLIASHMWWGDHDQMTLGLLRKQMTQADERQFTQIAVFRFALR